MNRVRNRIDNRFDQLSVVGRCALIPYLMAADPSPEVTVPMMHAMVNAGADLIELGVPFSDPMADGPVIQAASERSLEHHTRLVDVLELVTEFRNQDDITPVLLMGYLNPVEVMGYTEFAQAAGSAGVDGVLTVDIPPEEANSYIEALRLAHLAPIFLLAPTSDKRRIERIGGVANGFVYYVSLKGVTGAATLDTREVARKLAEIREIISLPIGVGFGIHNAEMAANVAQCADAVVVGSAIVKKMAANSHDTDAMMDDVSALLREMRKAMDAVQGKPDNHLCEQNEGCSR